ncbi:MAG: DUF1425 domain-containing protein [Candidatus Brocadiia bacterium]
MTMVDAVKIGTFAVLGTLALFACQIPEKEVETKKDSAGISKMARKHIVVEPGLAKGLTFVSFRKNHSKGRILFAQVGVRNETSSGIGLGYKFLWFDENGMQIKTLLSSWGQHYILPGETFHVRGTAPGQRAKDFSIQLRREE